MPSTAKRNEGPELQIIDPVYSFGTVMSGDLVKHTFRIRNRGQGVLVINNVAASCGCTAVMPSKTQLAASEEGEIAVSFNTRFHLGHNEAFVTLSTNDTRMPSVVMRMTGEVKAEVEATPAEIEFGNVHYGIQGTRRAIITAAVGGDSLRVQGVSNANPNLQITQVARDDGKAGAALVVRLLSTMPIGSFSDVIRVDTNRAPLMIPVFGAIVGDLRVNPARVSFGIVRRGQEARQHVALDNAGGRSVRILGISSSNQNVTATFQPLDDKRYSIALRLAPKAADADGPLSGTLTIRTDHPSQSNVIVPFFGTIASAK